MANIDSGNSGDDYCGLEFTFFGIKVPLIIRNCFFNAECKIHDYEYNNLIDFKKIGTKPTDLKFLAGMLKRANTSKIRKLRIVQAYVMYSVARQWGKMRWAFAQFNIIW